MLKTKNEKQDWSVRSGMMDNIIPLLAFLTFSTFSPTPFCTRSSSTSFNQFNWVKWFFEVDKKQAETSVLAVRLPAVSCGKLPRREYFEIISKMPIPRALQNHLTKFDSDLFYADKQKDGRTNITSSTILLLIWICNTQNYRLLFDQLVIEKRRSLIISGYS